MIKFASMYDFSWLRPSQADLQSVFHKPEQIKFSYFENDKLIRKRRLFDQKAASYDKYQLQNLEHFQQILKAKKLQLADRGLLLRFIYGGKFNLDVALEKYQKRLAYLSNSRIVQPSHKGVKLLKSGLMYVFGRDTNLRPVIVINVRKLDVKQYSSQDVFNAIVLLFGTVTEFMFYGGKIQNWVIIMDVDNAGIFDVDLRAGKDLFMTMAEIYPSHLAKLLLLRPSFMVRGILKMVMKLLDQDTRKKIQVLTDDNFNLIAQVVPASRLEKKYGGLLNDETEFWPISRRWIQPTHEDSYITVENDMSLRPCLENQQQQLELQQFPNCGCPVQ